MSEFQVGQSEPPPLRVLTLDGGGAKGFYTLGVLKEIEAMVGCPLHQKFDLVFGTGTGAIIASLIALGHRVAGILDLYRKHVPAVMSHKTAPGSSAALKTLASEVFGDATFANVKTGIGVVTAKWLTCEVSCDHIPRRSWALFRARDVMRGVIESFKVEQAA